MVTGFRLELGLPSRVRLRIRIRHRVVMVKVKGLGNALSQRVSSQLQLDHHYCVLPWFLIGLVSLARYGSSSVCRLTGVRQKLLNRDWAARQFSRC